MSDATEDPEDSPFLHQVLYTNDTVRVLSTFVSGLMTVAKPERVRAALQQILDNWPKHVEAYDATTRAAERLERQRPTA